MVVQHNLSAFNANRMLGITTNRQAKSAEKLASGFRINRAADDAAGLQISEKMRKQIRGLDQGARNTQDGISFLQVGDGAMNEVHAILQRINELAVQAANGTNSESDRAALNDEMQHLKKEINRIGNTTKFNELYVFDNNTVVFGLEGVPTDLEIFNATYDAAGDLQTFGGFVFHGERVPWTDIDPNMVKIENGKEVFVGGEYSYTSQDTTYSFAFHCKDGDELPLVTREISIEADQNGIVLGKERFDWSKVYDLDGNSLSASNLHGGPWWVDYYGAKLIFTVPEPLEDIDVLANHVNSKKSTTVYYDWEGLYGYAFTDEKAVDVLTKDVDPDVTYGKLSYNRVTQDMVDTMYDSLIGICYTVCADEDGIWLQDNTGNELTGSRRDWDSFGIKDWNDGLDIPGYTGGVPTGTYTYRFTHVDALTEVEFTFELSDVTDREAVIQGLNGMQLYRMPDATTYAADATIKNSTSDVKRIDFSDNILNLAFNEEYKVARDFEDENWEMSGLTATYSEADNTLTFVYNTDKYELSGELSNLESIAEHELAKYAEWLGEEKKNELLNGTTPSANYATDYSLAHNTTGTLTCTLKNKGQDIDLEIDYDFIECLANARLEDEIGFALVQATIPAAISDDLYVLDNGKYITTKELYDSTIGTNPNAEADILAMQCWELQTSNTGGLTIDDIVRNAVAGVMKEAGDEIASEVELNLTAQTYSKMGALKGDENTNSVKRPMYNSYLKETPIEPDIWIQHSSEVGDCTGISRYAMNTVAMGLTFSNLKTQESATQTLDSVSNALKYVSNKRSNYGALQNRLEHTLNNIENVAENTQAAESRIRDTDMAKEMVKYSMANVLAQAGQSVLAQANQLKQGILKLLQ